MEALRKLAAVLDEAVRVQPAADAVVADCGRPGRVLGEVGLRGAAVLADFVRLSHEAESLRVAAVDRPLLLCARQQLSFHRWMLREALHLAFLPSPGERSDALRLRLTGLGRTGTGLPELKAEVDHRLHGSASTTSTPGP